MSMNLPDLLTAELSGDERFELMERTRMNAVLEELALGASALVRQDAVARLGEILTCDWLVSGSIVPAGNRTIVWTKVIDVRRGLVVAIDAHPLSSGNYDTLTSEIAAFVGSAQANRGERLFIARGPIADMNSNASFQGNQWPARLEALIEKHVHDAGCGVAETAAVVPMYEERRLSAAGLTTGAQPLVEMQDVFWFLDGGCKWVDEEGGDLWVGLRVQRIGAEAKMLSVTAPAGEDLERKVLAALDQALQEGSAETGDPSIQAEIEFLAKRGNELAEASGPFRVVHPLYGNQSSEGVESYVQEVDYSQRMESTKDATIATYVRQIQRDPNDQRAKYMVSRGLLMDDDPAKREEGKRLLAELYPIGSSNYSMILSRAEEERAAAVRHKRLTPSTDLAGLEKAVAADRGDIYSRYCLGSLLLKSNDSGDRHRGKTLLVQVMRSDDEDLSDRAKTILPGKAIQAYETLRDVDPYLADLSLEFSMRGNDDPEWIADYYTEYGKLKEAQAELDRLRLVCFPKGMREVSKEDFNGAPQLGTEFTSESELLRAHRIHQGDVIVALNGYRVESFLQYRYIRDRDPNNPRMELILWDGEDYSEVNVEAPKRRFGVQMKDYERRTTLAYAK